MNNYTETNECQELKNIKYKTMLLSGTADISVTNLEKIPDLSGIETILENERKLNLKESWSKLDKTIKLKKLYEYCELLTNKDKLNSDEEKNLKIYMAKCLDRKQLGRVKDVVYNIEKGIIENIYQQVEHEEYSVDVRVISCPLRDKDEVLAFTVGPNNWKLKKLDIEWDEENNEI